MVELPRATYHRWASELTERDLSDAYLASKIVDADRASRKTYGPPRVWGQLRRNGIRASVNRGFGIGIGVASSDQKCRDSSWCSRVWGLLLAGLLGPAGVRHAFATLVDVVVDAV